MIVHHWHGQTFWLTHNRIMYWEEQNAIIASDLHIGKTGHFRKHGIAVPQDVYKEDLLRLFAALQHFKPKRFIIVGDLFHSTANKELDWFARWRNDFAAIDFVLVKGNHDILPASWYQLNNINVTTCLVVNGLLFIHDKDCNDSRVNLQNETILGTVSGHTHPAVVLKSGPRQEMRLPCFFFTPQQCILPAFSEFTGSFALKPKKEDRVFAITAKEIMAIP